MRIWLGASYVLGRDVLVGEPYPHICNLPVVGRMTPGVTYRMWRRDCAACVQEQHDARHAPDVQHLPPIDPELAAIEARMLGEHD